MFLHVSVILSTGVYDVTFCLWPHVPSGGGGGVLSQGVWSQEGWSQRVLWHGFRGVWFQRGLWSQTKGVWSQWGLWSQGVMVLGVMIRGVQYILPIPVTYI